MVVEQLDFKDQSAIWRDLWRTALSTVSWNIQEQLSRLLPREGGIVNLLFPPLFIPFTPMSLTITQQIHMPIAYHPLMTPPTPRRNWKGVLSAESKTWPEVNLPEYLTLTFLPVGTAL